MEEPSSKYIDHVSPISGKTRDVVTEIQAIVSETESNETLVGIGCDGCVTNTGKYSGIIRRLTPNDTIIKLVSSIVNYYVPNWFNIKTHHSCTDGARNFYFMISNINSLLPDCQAIVKTVLQKNVYWTHPENILLSAFTDSNPISRMKAASIIVDTRQSTTFEGRNQDI